MQPITPDSMDGKTTLPGMFFENAAKRRDEAFLWTKVDERWEAQTWGEIDKQVRDLAGGLRLLGVERGDRVALVSENRPEWLVADHGIMASGAVTVPAYTTNTVEDHVHILQNSGAVGIIVSTAALAARVLPAAHKVRSCKFLICLEALDVPKKRGFTVELWGATLAQGAAKPLDVEAEITALTREDLACITYTSGTGGAPKGVMLSHGAILCNVKGAIDVVSDGWPLGEESFLCFLPLSHSYEHMAGQFFPISIGANIYYAESVDKLADNLGETRPTIMTAVPRLFESLRMRVLRAQRSASPLRQKLFYRALDMGLKKMRGEPLSLGERLLDPLLERLVRAKVRGRFGGRLKALVSGGAALNQEVGEFFEALGLTILQGYGLTEAAPLISVNRRRTSDLTTVGPPVIDIEVKLGEDSEILVRGENVMLGYWQNPAATEQVVQNGWLHTGDIGQIDGAGRLRITDRKKDLIVNSGGDNISPARVEGFLSLETEIGQAMVYGDKQPNLTAVLVPDPEWLAEFKKDRGKAANLNLSDLVDDEDLNKALSDAVGRVNAKLSNIEKVRKFIIAREEFTTENGLLTPSLKVRRFLVKDMYGGALEALYEKSPAKKASGRKPKAD